MRTLNSIIALTLGTLSLISCNKGGTSIEGTVTGTGTMVLIDVSDQVADTLEVFEFSGANGDFSYPLEIDSLRHYFLFVTEQYNIPLLINPGDQIKLDIDATTPAVTYEVSGGKESERVKMLFDVTYAAMDKVDSLGQILNSSQSDPNFEMIAAGLNQSYQNILTETSGEIKAIIDEEPGSMANVYAFDLRLGQAPLLSGEEAVNYLEKVGAGLEETYPDDKITLMFNKRVKEIRLEQAQQKKMQEVQSSVSTGSPVPEISLPAPDGTVMNLSSLKGKIVLIDFWAAWCKPCRMENPNLVRIYNEYKDQGFTVYSVSLDGTPQQQDPKADWMKAIEQDGLIWDTHVSDLQGWRSSVVPKFGFQGIPYTVLVDRDGTIIATNLRGPQLEAKLKEVLGQG